jgi:hypothetical protein
LSDVGWLYQALKLPPALRVIEARKPPLCENTLAFEEVIDAPGIIFTGVEFK